MAIRPTPDDDDDEPSFAPEIRSTSEDRTLAMLCHLGGFFTSFLVPLVIWLVQKDKSRFVDHQGKEALNFQISLIIYYTLGAAVVLAIVLVGREPMLALVGFLLLGLLALFEIAVVILASVASYKGEAYRYPLTIRLVR